MAQRCQRACNHCRKRKARCDADPDHTRPCSNCQAAKKECVFEAATKRPISRARYIKALEQRVEQLDSLLKIAQAKASQRSTTPLDESDEDAALQFSLAPENAPECFMGESSCISWIEATLGHKQSDGDGSSPTISQYLSRRRSFWTQYASDKFSLRNDPTNYTFPSADLITSLSDLYFTRINVFLPLLHRPTFERQLKSQLHYNDSRFGAVLLAMCALGSRYSNDPRVLADGETSPLSNGWKWFNQIEILDHSLWTSVPCLFDFQVACLAVMFLDNEPAVSNTIISAAARMGQAVGAHRKRSALNAENELWKRAWWVLVCLDRMVSVTIAKPCIISYAEFDVALPTDCEDECWDIANPIQMLEPPSKPSTTSAFIYFIKLATLAAVTLDHLYGDRGCKVPSQQRCREKIVGHLETALRKWHEDIPRHLRWDIHNPNSIFFDQSVMLYSHYYNLQILIHRPFIPCPGQQVSRLSYLSLAMCANAARACANVFHSHYSRARAVVWNSHVPAFTSALILYLYLWSGRQSGMPVDPEEVKGNIEKCVNVLETCEQRSTDAGRWGDVLNGLASHREPEVHVPNKGVRLPPGCGSQVISD